jgi:hypothetical protein
VCVPRWYYTGTTPVRYFGLLRPQWTASAEHRHRTADHAIAVPPRLAHTNTTLVRRQPAARARTATRGTGSQAPACVATLVPYWYHTGRFRPPRTPRPASAQRARHYHTCTTPTPVLRQPAARAPTATRETGSQAPTHAATPIPYWYHTGRFRPLHPKTGGVSSTRPAVPHLHHANTTPVLRQPAARAPTATRETGSQASAHAATPIPHWYHTVPWPRSAAHPKTRGTAQRASGTTLAPRQCGANAALPTAITLVRAGPPSRPVLKLREEQRLASLESRTTLVSGRYHTSMD